MVESWVSSGVIFVLFFFDWLFGYFFGSYNDCFLIVMSILSFGICVLFSSYIFFILCLIIVIVMIIVIMMVSVECFFVFWCRFVIIIVVNFKFFLLMIDLFIVCKIIFYIWFVNSNSNLLFNEEYWWIVYYVFCSLFVFGIYGVFIFFLEKLVRMWVLRWEDVESDVGYERVRVKMFLGDECFVGLYLEGWGGLIFGVVWSWFVEVCLWFFRFCWFMGYWLVIIC